MALRLLILIVGVFCCSTAVIMIKQSAIQPVLLASLRLVVAAVVLTPLFLRDLRRYAPERGWRSFVPSALPGVVLGLHFITWIIGARLTPAANSSLIVNLVPIVMPFLMVLMIGERLNRSEIIATATALLGMLILTGGDFQTNPRYVWGDLMCFGSMLLFAFYLALGRRNRDVRTLWLYVVPLYWVSALFCLAAALPWAIPPRAFSQREVLLVLGLGIVPTVFGHSILNWSMKHLRGQVVSILNMGQFIFAGVMAFFIFGETPQWTFVPASALLIFSALLVVLAQRPAESAATPAKAP